MNEAELRMNLVHFAKRLNAERLNHGTSGNLSIRYSRGMLITPSGMNTEDLQTDDIVFMSMEGKSSGIWEPSSEWLFHRDIYAQRPEFGAVIHTHSIAATALACLRKSIPKFHYMVALLGGDSIRCADYATFGSQQLSNNAVLALQDRKACLLANHGMIAAGENLEEAFRNSMEVETLSEIYLRTLQVGKPILLSVDQFREAQMKFESYGKTKSPKEVN